ncbi:uncharacterized protein DUF695 [Herbihabitans rhizosphaerae]|uniref:Uncharacterized protein DUF695 n=1 Tax=Herbihabitans rhizosphaerae TaxID=1872711 RepID=A0A4Q7KLM8_9PSEU|nr:DUF695 domain-containing protein [Herbihabitans rhizosphaerae]RZS34856.1 uncharacterized protein DUF695 [Herbihabitans rhizosphaerae]
MGIFRKRGHEPVPVIATGDPLDMFWAWWTQVGAAETAAAIQRGKPQPIVQSLGPRVAAISPELDWELTPGVGGAQHALVVTAAGRPQARAIARRWRRRAPAADAIWEYLDARPPARDVGETVIALEHGPRVAAAEVLVAAEPDNPRACLHLALHHPAFAAMTDRQRMTAVFLLLDAAIGEQAVETWIGRVDPLPNAPAGAVPLPSLPELVRRFVAGKTDAKGDGYWTVLEGRTPQGDPVLAMAELPLRPMRLPHLDAHVLVTLPFTDVDSSGLPGPGSRSNLRSLEEHVTGLLGESGRMLAHETAGGVRRLHVYVDSWTPAAEQLRAACAGWDQGEVTVEVTPDPGWDRVRHLAG